MSHHLTDKEIFDKYITKTESCWNWTGPMTERGYGRIEIWGNKILAHRFVFERLARKLSSSEKLHHKCNNKVCVNPDHLLVYMNVLFHPDSGAVVNKSKIHCPVGHEYNELNTYIDPDGGRICRACRREKDRIRNAKGRNHGKKRT